MSELIKRTYRITKKQDLQVKKRANSKRNGVDSESGYIRRLIDKDVIPSSSKK